MALMGRPPHQQQPEEKVKLVCSKEPYKDPDWPRKM